VVSRGLAGLAGVEVAGEEEVDAAVREHLHRLVRAADEFEVAVLVGQVEGVVGDDDLGHRFGERIEVAMDRRQLLLVDPSVLKRQRARRVDADDGDLGVDERRLEVGVDQAAVLAERAEEALPDSIERHVVVAGDDDLRFRQAVEIALGRLELARLRALRQVARDDDEVGAGGTDRREQRLEDGLVGAAEVQVGKVGEGSHWRGSIRSYGRVRAAEPRAGWRGGFDTRAAASSP